MLPQPYNAESKGKNLAGLPDIPDPSMSDAGIVVQMFFGTKGFMNHWNMGAMSIRTDVRDAFVRNWHRANRWNVAFFASAVKKGLFMPMPTMDTKGLVRTAVMGG